MKAFVESKIKINLARDCDFERIFSIWLDGIGNSFDDRELSIETLKERFWTNFSQRKGIFNFWVAIDEQEQILGWQSLIRVSNNPFLYDKHAESSTYISRSNRQDGIGERLLDFVIKEAEKSELEYVVGYISVKNDSALKIIERTGWQVVGQMPASLKGKSKIEKYFIVRPV
ncbi:GNAT family N-acetyltransferase [Taibaiella soli]|uniref:N-acetyltransferase domain-containing protein n=1 Tax=Taibaiella soli TaxID=1649169 RepID=A0A2W2A8Y4_9BACT|nr:GNAT family N-acetyltransferase [Taibaiella soli]PZF71775.1 hypothetical protein DN068_17065 [Taibaiella soli]